MKVTFVIAHSHERDARARLVDLPHVQLLVLVQSGLELSRSETARHAALLRLRHPNGPPRTLAGQLPQQREDHVGRTLRPRDETRQ